MTFHHYPLQGEQFHMYMRGLRHYRECAEWIALLDIDEFLALRGGMTLDALLDQVPPNQGCLLVNWAMFGPGGHATPPPGGVREAYTRRAARVSATAKTITRGAAIALDRIDRRRFFWHGWEDTLAPGATSRNVLGLAPEDMATDGAFLADPEASVRMVDRAVVHHYEFRSFAALGQRWRRGLGGDFAGQEIWKRAQEDGSAADQMAEFDAVEDRFLAEHSVRTRARRIAAGALLARSPWPNLALGRPARQSSVSAWSRGATTEQDAAGAVNGRITGGYQCHTDVEAAPWWQVDLGAPARVHEVRVFNRIDSAAMAARLRHFMIETSRDGRHWLAVCRKTDDARVGGIDATPFRFLPPTPVPARFVRLRLLEAGVLHLDQVEVDGEAAA